MSAVVTDRDQDLYRHKSGFSSADTIIDLYTRRFTRCQSRHSTGVERRHQFQLWSEQSNYERRHRLSCMAKTRTCVGKTCSCSNSRRPNEIDNRLKYVVWSQSPIAKPRIEVENCQFRCAHAHNCHLKNMKIRTNVNYQQELLTTY